MGIAEILQEVLNVALVVIQVVWLWLVAIYKAVVPAQYQRMKDVSGKVVLITGAGSGLGRLMSLRFAKLGSKLVLWDINEAGNKETEQMVISLGAKVWSYTVDLAVRDQVYAVADKVKQDAGDVDILINNAGIVTGRKFMDCSDSLIEKTVEVNTNAHFWTVKSFLPKMLEKNSGHVVSVASSAGLFGVAGLADYCASKFGAVGFDESLRNEMSRLGKTGVRTTVVCPYFIDTGMFTGVQTYVDFLVPPLKAEYVARKIVEATLTDQEILMLPKTIYLLYALKGIMPISVTGVLMNKFGMNRAMDNFTGREKQK